MSIRKHQGPPRRICDIMARHGGSATSRHQAREARTRGFSLIEVLLSVFILGIGVISIAALFPAGIAQQRQSVDDITGPIVAQNALAILRTKLRPADFGTREAHNPVHVSPTIEGDFGWSRPAFYTSETNVNGFLVPRGSIDIFNAVEAQTFTEIPYAIPVVTPPHIIFTQSERYYPMAPIKASVIRPPKPQYVWDCMFRRFQGKVMVAIFVYRTTIVGGGDVAYSVPENPSNAGISPMPISLDLTKPETLQLFPDGPWDAPFNNYPFINGTTGNTVYNTADQAQSWQEPGQWILDQNNNLHRVLSQNRTSLATAVEVELVRPVPAMPVLPVYFLLDAGNETGILDVVSNIFYIPREVTLDGVPVRLTTVYVTVREL